MVPKDQPLTFLTCLCIHVIVMYCFNLLFCLFINKVFKTIATGYVPYEINSEFMIRFSILINTMIALSSLFASLAKT